MSKNQSVVTPELIKTMARQLQAAGRQNNGSNNEEDTASPQLIKFKFVLCDVEINNHNTAAEENDLV